VQPAESPSGAPDAAAEERRNSLAGVPLLAGLAEDIDRGTTPLEAGPWAELAASAEPVRVRAGEWLFRQGDPGDSLYVVLTGRLEIVIESGPEVKVIRVLGRGASVGELALLTESPRSASVRARRDSELLLVTREHFAALLERRPEFAAGLTRVLGRQLRDVRHAGLEPDPVPSTVTVVGLCAGLPVRDIGSYLALLLSQYQPVAGIDDRRAADAAEGADNGDPNAAYARLLEHAERDNKQVVLAAPVADVTDAWSAFSVRAADRLIGVCRGREAPPEGISEIRRLHGCDLVVTSDGHESGARLDAWVQALQPRSVRLVPEAGGDAPGIESLARRLAGRSTGLVLSGGGARAFAHVGVLTALRDAGVKVDRVAGCSGGAWVGAQFALGRSPEEIRINCHEEFVKRNPLNDYTLPLVALTRSIKGNAMMDRVFGDVRFEELEREFFCVSCDMISSELVVHRRGPLWPAVAASMTLPGYLPPKSIDGRLLLDGGVLNNLPVDVMAATGEGPIIASDVSARYQPPALRPQRARRPRTARWAAQLRRWVVGSDAVLPGFGETVVRSILLGSIDTAEAAQRYADVVIEPSVAGVGLLEWDRVDDMIDAGRVAAEKALAAAPAGLL
jgi:predicted acylesterase/phospholipase RssA/CRP-like cAMP-binding protein